jgi:hypothetical protein
VNSSSFTYTYELLGDQVVEPDEVFTLVLSVGAETEASIAQGSSVATVTIGDNDGKLYI